MNTIRITTSQNIDLEYELGSLGDRIVGRILDGLVIFEDAAVAVGSAVGDEDRVAVGADGDLIGRREVAEDCGASTRDGLR